MITFNNYKRVLILSAVALSSKVAAAQTGECSANADCDPGFSCEIVGSSGCAGVDCDPAAPDCKPVECDPEELRACVPAACEDDADCAAGWLCHELDAANCATPACPPGEDCEQTPECEPVTRSQCTPRYALPCEDADDCGAGFDCVTTEREQCTCSGGTSTPPTGAGGSAPMAEDPVTEDPPPPTRDGGAAPSTPEQDCTCTTEEVNYCKVLEVACSSDSDCPQTWSCTPYGAGEDLPRAQDAGAAIRPEPNAEEASDKPGAKRTTPRQGLPELDAGVNLPSDAGLLTTTVADAAASQQDAGTPAPSAICLPPYYYDGPRDDGQDTGGEGPTTPGEDDEEPGDNGSDADAAAPGTIDDPDGTRDAAAPGGSMQDAGEPDDENQEDSDDGCACSVVGASPAPSRSAWGLLGLLGLGLLRRRGVARR